MMEVQVNWEVIVQLLVSNKFNHQCLIPNTMKIITWLLTLAGGKQPILFSLALLLVGITVMGIVVKHQENEIKECALEKTLDRLNYDRRVDSVSYYYQTLLRNNEQEVKETLQLVIQNYKEQLEEQKQVNSKIKTTISKNNRIIRKNNSQLKILQK